MDLRDSPEEAAFRKEVVDFIEKEAPKFPRGTRLEEVLVKSGDWFRKLAARGWIAPAWPQEYGGAGMSVVEQFIFNEEMAIHRAPRPLHLIIAQRGLGLPRG